jgi:hypothetical protein
VYGTVDNGQTARVQIGEIAGTIDLAGDSITGAIEASWFTDEVSVECFPWGAPDPTDMKFDNISPSGADEYTCSWAGEWDIQPYQDVGVGYIGPDGHWVANAFFARNARIVASAAGDWFWTAEFNPGLLNLSIYASQDPGAPLLWGGTRDTDDSGFLVVGFADHGVDLLAGHYLVISDGTTQKGLVLETITMDVFDTDNEIMAGTAPAGREVVVVAGMAEAETQESLVVQADPLTGAWMADFAPVPFDITEEMRPWSFTQIFDDDGDANEADAPPVAATGNLYAVPDENRIWANEWIQGSELSLTIFDSNGDLVYSDSRVVLPPSERPWTEVLFESGFDLVPGQRIVINQGGYERELLVSSIHVTGFDLGAQTIFGTGDSGAEFIVAIDGVNVGATVDGDGTWAVQHENLTGGVWGSAIQFDEDRDSTRDIFAAPNPNLYAVPDENRIWANEWIEGGEISLTIFDLEGVSVYSESRFVPPPSENPWTAVLFELEDFVLEPGQRIVINQGGYVRELIVSSIHVTVFDLGARTISGTGDSGAEFFVRIGGTDEWGIVRDDGTWSVHNGDLAAGVWGEAIQPDADGDATRDGFQAPAA